MATIAAATADGKNLDVSNETSKPWAAALWFQDVINDFCLWYKRQCPESFVAKANHLIEEVGEIANKPKDILEYADALMLLIALADMQGFSFNDIANAMAEKHEINQKRKWYLWSNGKWKGTPEPDYTRDIPPINAKKLAEILGVSPAYVASKLGIK